MLTMGCACMWCACMWAVYEEFKGKMTDIIDNVMLATDGRLTAPHNHVELISILAIPSPLIETEPNPLECMATEDEERFRALIEKAIEEDGLTRHKNFKKDVKADKKRKAKADKVGQTVPRVIMRPVLHARYHEVISTRRLFFWPRDHEAIFDTMDLRDSGSA